MPVVQAQTVIVQGGNLFNVEQGNQDVLSVLRPHVSPNARYNARYHEEPARCHPGTRERILRELNERLDELDSRPFVWTHGPAGVGKTAVMRTLCEQFDADNRLLGSFFFFKADPTRNSGQSFVPSLVYLLCQAVEELRVPILEAIRRDPAVLDLSLEDQARKLLIEPILTLVQSQQFPTRPAQALVVDGFDECDPEYDRDQIIRILNRLSHVYPSPLLIIVTSRPHFDIRTHFETSPLMEKTTQKAIYQDNDADADIRKYLIDKFDEIRKKHRLRDHLPLSANGRWPSLVVIEILVEKASGQFIFVATIIRFVQPPNVNPENRLQILLGHLASDEEGLEPFELLDQLYRAILAVVPPPRLQGTLDMLAICVVYPYSPSWTTTSGPISIKHIPCIRPVSHFVELVSPLRLSFDTQPPLELLSVWSSYRETYFQECASHLESLVEVIPAPDQYEDIYPASSNNPRLRLHTVRSYHKSFADFLSSETRAGPSFFLHPDRVWQRLAEFTLQHDFWHEDSVMKLAMFELPFLFQRFERSIIWLEESTGPSTICYRLAESPKFLSYDYGIGLSKCDPVSRHRRWESLSCANSFVRGLQNVVKFDPSLARICDLHLRSFQKHLQKITSVYTAQPELFALMALSLGADPTENPSTLKLSSSRGRWIFAERRYQLSANLRRALNSSPVLLRSDIEKGLGITDSSAEDTFQLDLSSSKVPYWACDLRNLIHDLVFNVQSQAQMTWYSVLDIFAEKAVERGEVSQQVSQVVFSRLSFQYGAAGINGEELDDEDLVEHSRAQELRHLQQFLDKFPNHLSIEDRLFVQRVIAQDRPRKRTRKPWDDVDGLDECENAGIHSGHSGPRRRLDDAIPSFPFFLMQ